MQEIQIDGDNNNASADDHKETNKDDDDDTEMKLEKIILLDQEIEKEF